MNKVLSASNYFLFPSRGYVNTRAAPLFTAHDSIEETFKMQSILIFPDSQLPLDPDVALLDLIIHLINSFYSLLRTLNYYICYLLVLKCHHTGAEC